MKDVTFNLLSSTFGDASAKSSAGAINGGSVVAEGSVTLTAAGAVVFTNINAGQEIHIIPSAGLAPNAWARRISFLFAFADNGTVFSTHPTSTTLHSAGLGFNVRPGPVTFSASAGFPLRTALPAQKNPTLYARVSVHL